MKQTAVFRITGEICFFFSVLYIFNSFKTWRLPMALFAAACFALGFVIVRCRGKLLRLLLSLLPGLCFLLGPWNWLLLFPALAWIYYILVMTQGNWAMPLEEYRKTYTWMMVICLFFVAGNIANATIYRGHLISAESLIYVFLFLFLGVFAMRRMQMGADMSRSWKLSNALSVAGFPLLAVGGSVLLFLFLRFTQPAVKYLLTPVGRFILWLSRLLFPSLEEGDLPTVSIMKPDVNALPQGPPETSHGVRGAFDADSILTGTLKIEKAASIGAYVLLGLLLLLALYLVLQHVKRNQVLQEGDELYYDETETAAPQRNGRRKKAAPVLGNARQLRRIYQTYLEFVNARGVSVGKTDTSQDVLERAEKQRRSEDARRLRELYIAARYGDPDAVTRQQVEEAQACLERILEVKTNKAE